MGISVIPFVLMVMVPIVTGSTGQRAIGGKSGTVTGNDLDYPNYLNNDEYPVVVSKKAALLLDQLMVALQKVVDKQGGNEVGGSRGISRSPMPRISAANSEIVPVTEDEQTMDLQRRGQVKGKVYWRCYFNAVTCFKRK